MMSQKWGIFQKNTEVLSFLKTPVPVEDEGGVGERSRSTEVAVPEVAAPV